MTKISYLSKKQEAKTKRIFLIFFEIKKENKTCSSKNHASYLQKLERQTSCVIFTKIRDENHASFFDFLEKGPFPHLERCGIILPHRTYTIGDRIFSHPNRCLKQGS